MNAETPNAETPEVIIHAKVNPAGTFHAVSNTAEKPLGPMRADDEGQFAKVAQERVDDKLGKGHNVRVIVTSHDPRLVAA